MALVIHGMDMPTLRRNAEKDQRGGGNFYASCTMQLIDAYNKLYRETEELRQGNLFGVGAFAKKPPPRNGV